MTTQAVSETAALFDAFRRAAESNDYDALVGLYADDASFLQYSERNRPSSASALEGREAIRAMFDDVATRHLKHELRDEVLGGDRFAFSWHCTYPTGEKVVELTVCEVAGGRIVRHTGASAWDE